MSRALSLKPPPPFLGIVFAGTLTALVPPAPAHGSSGEIQATAVFAVARDPSGQKAAAIADAVIRSRVSKSRTLRLIEPARVLSGDPRTREEDTLDRARAALTDGRRAYDALELDDAIARLGQAVSLYQQTGPLLGDLDELQTAFAYLGAALTLRGSADEGESTFVELLTVNPSFQLRGFPPAVERVFERAVDRVEKTPSGVVEIYSTPPYAAVYIDGRFEGVTPFELRDFVAGTHYLRIEQTGYTVHGAPLEISPNQSVTSNTRLRNIKRGAELRDLAARCTHEVLADGMGGALRNLTRLLVADTLIFVAVTQSGNDATFTGGVFDAATGMRLTTERVVLSVESERFRAELDEYISRLIMATGATEDAAGVATGSPSGEGNARFGLGGGSSSLGGTSSGGSAAPPPYGTVPSTPPATPAEIYLGWSMVGVGGAAVVTGLVFGILAQGVHSDYRATAQGSPDLESIRTTGKTDALVADLCYLGGGLAVVGGVAILFLTKAQEPTAQEILMKSRASLTPTDGGAVFSLGAEF